MEATKVRSLVTPECEGVVFGVCEAIMVEDERR